jgi:hypothetical protein
VPPLSLDQSHVLRAGLGDCCLSLGIALVDMRLSLDARSVPRLAWWLDLLLRCTLK